MIDYAGKIDAILAKMDGISKEILPANRSSVDTYASLVWDSVEALTVTLKDEYSWINQDKFATYIQSEEDRLKERLKGVDYIIDGKDTLSLIAGVGRPERVSVSIASSESRSLVRGMLQTVFPVLYLLLKRHYDIMRIARTKVISPKEMADSAESISNVMSVMSDRVSDLQSISSLSAQSLSCADFEQFRRHLPAAKARPQFAV